MTKDPNDYNVRAVERALQILGCFDDQHQERGISEIAQAVDLHKATAHRIVTTLVNYGYLERAATGRNTGWGWCFLVGSRSSAAWTCAAARLHMLQWSNSGMKRAI
jgi:DNA-binding IclR family transcriptional regulator